MIDTTKPTIHIGICLAGSVSAGAYLGGAMDILLNNLDKWERFKQQYPEKVTHNIVVDVIGGASGGGISAALFALEVCRRQRYEPTEGYRSLFYEAWVTMFLQNQEPIHELLKTNDLWGQNQEPESIKSLLNSNFIDEMLHKVDAIYESTAPENIPSYISKDLAIVLTLTNLNGFPVKINMRTNNDIRSHNMYLHRDTIRFSLSDSPAPSFVPLILDGENRNVKTLVNAAGATSAFPIGFKPRAIKRGLEIVKAQLETEFNTDAIEVVGNEPLQTLNVDGGAMNNEPFDEVNSLLNKMTEKAGENDIKVLLMIDPFPSEEKKEKNKGAFSAKGENPQLQHSVVLDLKDITHFDENDNTFDFGMAVITALRNQSMFKTSEVLNARFQKEAGQYLIIPSNKSTNPRAIEKYENEALATSSLGAFGGFLNLKFREHDYQLGRHNMDSFLTKHFKVNEQLVLPSNKEAIETAPSFENVFMTLSELVEIKKQLENRIDNILENLLLSRTLKLKQPKERAIPDVVLLSYLEELDLKSRKSLFSTVLIWFSNRQWVQKGIKRYIKKQILDMIVKFVVKDLKERGLLSR
jgi:predicted acylesterase/phospholipase RssA